MFRTCMLVAVLLGAAGQSRGQEVADAGYQFSSHPTLQQMHHECNSRRAQNGRYGLALDEQCCLIAQRWATRMAREGFFQHGGGEQIIAVGQGSVYQCFNDWMDSSGHRGWILRNGITRAGWGCFRAPNGQYYWVGCFR